REGTDAGRRHRSGNRRQPLAHAVRTPLAMSLSPAAPRQRRSRPNALRGGRARPPTMWMKSVRRLVGEVWHARAWRPEHARLLWSQLAHRPGYPDARLTDRDHLRAAADWLCRAQDAMPDGGVCGRYSLKTGWSSSYPETTGYVIPTFLALAQEFRDNRFEDRAARAVGFLLSVQLRDGAFRAGDIRHH